MTPRAARLLRGALLGTVATLLAAVSHAAGGGPVPGGLALVLGCVFATAVGTIALGRVEAGRRGSPVRTAVAVGIAQLAFHLGFSLLGTGGAVRSTGGHHHALLTVAADPATAIAQGGAGMWLAHLVAAVAPVRTAVAVGIAQLAFHLGFSLLGTGGAVRSTGGHHHALVTVAADPAAAIAQGGAGMWLAHLVAAVATVLYLRHLEGRVWAVLARLGGFLLRALGIRMPQRHAPHPRPAVSRTVIAASAWLRDAIARRGPPAVLGA